MITSLGGMSDVRIRTMTVDIYRGVVRENYDIVADLKRLVLEQSFGVNRQDIF